MKLKKQHLLVNFSEIKQELETSFFLWVVQTDHYNNQAHNIFTFNTFQIGANHRRLSKAQLEVNNSIYYPQLEFSSQKETRLYGTLLKYNSAYNDFLSGSLINRANYENLFGIIYFDLSYSNQQKKQVGQGIWTTLASIAIPLLVDAASSLFLKKGKGLMVSPRPEMMMPYNPPVVRMGNKKEEGVY